MIDENLTKLILSFLSHTRGNYNTKLDLFYVTSKLIQKFFIAFVSTAGRSESRQKFLESEVGD